MKSNPKVSVIIPCNGYEKYLKSCIKSILKIKDIEKEIVIVFYGQSKLNDSVYLNDISTVRTVYCNSNNVQKARNKGVEMAQGFAIVPLDADDMLISTPTSQSYLKIAFQNLKRNPNLALVTGISYKFGNEIGITSASYPVNEKDIVFKSHIKTSIVFRKSDFKKGCRYHSNIIKWQDWSFAISLLNCRLKKNKENRILFLNKIIHGYRITNKETISKSRVSEYSMIKRTVQDEPEIFYRYFKNSNINIISKQILERKPTLIEDFFGIVNFNAEYAKRFYFREILKHKEYYNVQEAYKKLFPHSFD